MPRRWMSSRSDLQPGGQRIGFRLGSDEYPDSAEVQEDVGGIGRLERHHRDVERCEGVQEVGRRAVSPADDDVGLECRDSL